MCSDAQIFILLGFSVRAWEPATNDSVTDERKEEGGRDRGRQPLMEPRQRDSPWWQKQVLPTCIHDNVLLSSNDMSLNQFV